MSEILQPCPFCGGTNICTEKGINLNYCDSCSAEANIEHWNNRPIEDALRARIAELEATVEVGADIAKAYENRVSEIVALSNETVGKLNSRIAELEGCIEELKKRIVELNWADRPALVGELKSRIAKLEKDNTEFRQLIRDWSIVLDQNNEFQLWQVESVRQAMLEINKECEK